MQYRFHWLIPLALVPLCRDSSARVSPPGADGIPIDVREQHGVDRVHELITVTVPFHEDDDLTGVAGLRVVDESGTTRSSQWRVLTRWRGSPSDTSRPIKFALGRFFVDVPADGYRRFYVLSDSALSASTTPDDVVKLRVRGDQVSITTGPARFEMNMNEFNLLDMVSLDFDDDGKFHAEEQVLDRQNGLGAVLLDTLDGGYLARVDPKATWQIEEIGPLTTTLRVDGVHLSTTPVNIGRDFLQWTTRLTFTAGSTAVDVEQILRNSYLDQPLGHISFARYLIRNQLLTEGKPTVTFGTDEGMPPSTHVLNPGEEAFVYQDSSGTPNWSQPGTSFAGFRIYQHVFGLDTNQPESLPSTSPAAAGSQASGWMDVRDASKGVLVALRYPWQNYPYALRCTHDGKLSVDLWPAEFQGLHWIDDAQRKAHRFALLFHRTEIDAQAEARRYAHPLRPHVTLDYLKSTRAWGDQGDIRDASATYDQMEAEGDEELKVMYDSFDQHGNFSWVHFGEPIWSQNTHQAGSWRNRLTWFDRYLTSGAHAWFELAEIFALHSMNLRTYHIDGFKADDHPGAHLLEGVPHYTGWDDLGRNSIPSAYDPYKVGIPAGGHGWNGFDPEHMTADDLYEYYLMTGSFNALDAMRHMGEAMLTWHGLAPDAPIISARGVGWPLRALMKIYAVTGDQRILGKATDVVDNIEQSYGQTASPVTGITYHYVARNIYAHDKHAMTEDFELPWQVATTLYGLMLYARDTGDDTLTPMVDDIADYLVTYCIQDGVFVDALACDNHLDFNPKDDNTGVNLWLSSALAIVYRSTGDPSHYQWSKALFDQNRPTSSPRTTSTTGTTRPARRSRTKRSRETASLTTATIGAPRNHPDR